MEQTSKYKLNKPSSDTDYVTDDRFWKENWDKVEAQFAAIDSSFTGYDKKINEIDTGMLNVIKFGAKVDGKTNDTTVVQSAIDSLGTNGGIIYIPHRCLYNRADLVLNKKVLIIDDSGVKRHISNSEEWDLSYHTEMEFIGHRGLSSLYPESSTIAMKNSILNGQAHSVEFDIRNSVDEKLFAFHDYTMDRTTNKTGAIKDLTETEIRAADAGTKFSPIYAGTKIAYLNELCSELRGLPVKYIYPQTNIGEIVDTTAQKRILTNTINTFIEYGLLHKMVLQCIDLDVASKVREINPRIKIGIMLGSSTVDGFNTALEWAKLDRNCLIGSDSQLFLDNPTLALKGKKEGIDIFTWTVDNLYDVDKLRKSHVYRIMTNVNLMGVR